MAKPRRVVVIPALNEEKSIGAVVSGARQYVDEVIVVDDASTDGTPSVARQNGATVISHASREGYDRTIGDGFELAMANKADIVITLDADGQHVPSDILGLVDAIEKGEADIVVGRRPRRQRFSESVFAAIAKITLGIDDPLCGFKAYSARVYRDIGFFDRISSVGTQLIFLASWKGYRLAQADIGLKTRGDVPRYGGRVVSNFKILGALVRILLTMIRE